MTTKQASLPLQGLERFRNDIARCIKCGSCRAVCPSFLVDRDESCSARGRMALIKAVLDGRLAPTALYEERLETCTGCLACEAVCASSVPVSSIIQAAREHAVTACGRGILKSLMSRLFASPRAMQSTAWFAPLALHYAPASFTLNRRRISRRKRPPVQPKKARLVFFPGCSIAYFQPAIGAACLDVLGSLGYEVIIPSGLACCGRPLLSLGDREAARSVAERNRTLFADAATVVTACASCSLTFKKEYPRLLRPEAGIPEFLDVHELVAREIAAASLRPLNKTVTWHDPCHLGRGQGLARIARDTIRAIPGITLVEMQDPDACCGFGGVMRITQRRVSDAIGDRKAANIIATKADAVVTGCPSCRMQIADALARSRSTIEVLHTLQLLQEALREQDADRRDQR